MRTKGKNIFFFLTLATILLFIAGCGKQGAKNTATPTPAPASTDPFLQPLPIEKSPEKYITKTYEERVPEQGVITLTSNERTAILPPPLVIKTLKIKQGMEILDIGAGRGTFTFPMADELKNTGHVYATEVELKLIKDLQDWISQKEYKNVTPALVEREGVDSFYKKHHFDIILVCETIPCFRDITAYFRELRPSLKKGGRLYIINFRNISDFHEVDFGDYKEILITLHKRGEKFPVFKRLDKEVQDFIENLSVDNLPPVSSEIKTRIVKNFNQMLSDRFLINDLVDYFASMGYYKQDKEGFPAELEWPRPFIVVMNPSEVALFKWLFVHLDEDGVFDRENENKTLTAEQTEELQKLNKIILTGIFHLYTTSITKGEFQPAIFLEKKSIITKMRKAGYKLTNDYNILPQYFFLEFERI